MEELKSYLNVRGNLYKLFSYPFYMEADSKYLEELAKYIPVLEAVRDVPGTHSGDLAEGLGLLKSFLAKNPNKKTLDDLACIFARLFFVMNIQAGINGVSPQESAYLSDTHSMMQEERDQVLKYYYDEGMGRNRDVFHEPEDHLSAELDFLGAMSVKTAAFLNEGKLKEADGKLISQRDFMEAHLMKWIEPVCGDVYCSCESDFYRGLAKTVLGFVRFDFRQLSDICSAAV